MKKSKPTDKEMQKIFDEEFSMKPEVKCAIRLWLAGATWQDIITFSNNLGSSIPSPITTSVINVLSDIEKGNLHEKHIDKYKKSMYPNKKKD